MNDFLAIVACVAVLALCFWLMKSAKHVRKLQIYDTGPPIDLEIGKLREVSVVYGEYSAFKINDALLTGIKCTPSRPSSIVPDLIEPARIDATFVAIDSNIFELKEPK